MRSVVKQAELLYREIWKVKSTIRGEDGDIDIIDEVSLRRAMIRLKMGMSDAVVRQYIKYYTWHGFLTFMGERKIDIEGQPRPRKVKVFSVDFVLEDEPEKIGVIEVGPSVRR